MIDKEDALQELAGLIYKARRAENMTQAQLAARVGLSRAAITNIEGGRQNVSIWALLLFAEALRIDPRSLVPTGDKDKVKYRCQIRVKRATERVAELQYQLMAARTTERKLKQNR